MYVYTTIILKDLTFFCKIFNLRCIHNWVFLALSLYLSLVQYSCAKQQSITVIVSRPANVLLVTTGNDQLKNCECRQIGLFRFIFFVSKEEKGTGHCEVSNNSKYSKYGITFSVLRTEMKFLDIKLTKDLSLLLHAIHSSFYGRF
jgi:hypothetical protein